MNYEINGNGKLSELIIKNFELGIGRVVNREREIKAERIKAESRNLKK
ncbi:MAG: hypothetical protein K9M80_05685 [Candidatus Marinimicrobia bacterium]|nr:hypothetical protein [Candidatus Neomarinimicrobiota bacterium]